nr:protein phosphatase 2C, putative [Haemonchus contortus]
MRRSRLHEDRNSPESESTVINRNRESRWDPTIYKPSEFYGNLAELFAKLRQGLGSQLNRYLVLLKLFSKQSLSTYELSKAVEKLLSSELLSIHDEFVGLLSESCQLSTVLRSVEEIFNGRKSRDSRKGYIPHISTINALLILRSLENGWAAPDPSAGQLLGDAVKTMLADRIDAAVHVRKKPILDGIGFRSGFQPVYDNSIERKHSIHHITTADLYESFSDNGHFLGAETPNLLRMKCHSNFYEKLKSSLSKTQVVNGQARPQEIPVPFVPECERVEEATVFESFCNVTCVAAYANIFINAVNHYSIFSGPIHAPSGKSSLPDEEMEDEEEPMTLQESQLASESRKLIKSMESSMSKSRGRKSHRGRPAGAAVSSLDRDAIQKAQAIIEAWRLSSYEVVPDEVDLSLSERNQQKTNRSHPGSLDSIPMSADTPESSHEKVSRSKTQRRARTLPSKKANKNDLPIETTQQKGDDFLSPESSQTRAAGKAKSTPLPAGSADERAESSQTTQNVELASQVSPLGTQENSQKQHLRGRKPKKVIESVASEHLDTPRSVNSAESFPHSETGPIHSTQAIAASSLHDAEKSPEVQKSQHDMLTAVTEPRIRTNHPRRGRPPKKVVTSLETKEMASARPLKSDKIVVPSEVDPMRSPASSASSPERPVENISEAMSSQRVLTQPSQLSSSETQEDSQTRKPRGRKPRKLEESERHTLDSTRPLRSSKKLGPAKNTESPNSSPERSLDKSSRRRGRPSKLSSPTRLSSSETQDDSHMRHSRRNSSPKRLPSSDTTDRASKNREQDSSEQDAARDVVETVQTKEAMSRKQRPKFKEHAQMRGANVLSKDLERSRREGKKISLENRTVPERIKKDETSSLKASVKRAPAGKDDERRTIRSLRSSSQSSGEEDVPQMESVAKGRFHERVGKERAKPSDSAPSNRRSRMEDKTKRHSKKPDESDEDQIDEPAKSRKMSLRQRDH